MPVLGSAVDMLFPGHILAVRALRADLERRFGPIPAENLRGGEAGPALPSGPVDAPPGFEVEGAPAAALGFVPATGHPQTLDRKMSIWDGE